MSEQDTQETRQRSTGEYDESDMERDAEWVERAFTSPDFHDAATGALARIADLARDSIAQRRRGAEQRNEDAWLLRVMAEGDWQEIAHRCREHARDVEGNVDELRAVLRQYGREVGVSGEPAPAMDWTEPDLAHGVTPGTNGTRGGVEAQATPADVVERALAFVADFHGDPHCALNCLHAEALAGEVRALRSDLIHLRGYVETLERERDELRAGGTATARGVVRDADEGAALVEAFKVAVRHNGRIAGMDSLSACHEDEPVDEDGPRQALLAALRASGTPDAARAATPAREGGADA